MTRFAFFAAAALLACSAHFYLPKSEMYSGDFEGTVDGCHPNDLGMMSMSRAFGAAVRKALKLR